jgi:hypothetical protein
MPLWGIEEWRRGLPVVRPRNGFRVYVFQWQSEEDEWRLGMLIDGLR